MSMDETVAQASRLTSPREDGLYNKVSMDNPRKYGKAPYDVALVHGGPGAPGEMAPVARELSHECGVLEPLQTRETVDGQLEELRTILDENGDLPVTLVGYSWGAILGFIFAARNPSYVRKLILLSSGVFEDAYVERIKNNRLKRLSERERARLDDLMQTLNDPDGRNKNAAFARLGELLDKADSYDPLPHENDVVAYQHDVFKSVWEDAEALRKGGQLLRLGKQIECPVVAIHGDFDPHPYEGILTPLSRVLADFRMILLEKCGHHPWYEKYAKDEFYTALKRELEDRS
jgi:pimeloyl-ACP methyl ester carboxylesterase